MIKQVVFPVRTVEEYDSRVGPNNIIPRLGPGRPYFLSFSVGSIAASMTSGISRVVDA
jgi:hypothetical protein